MKTKAKFFRLFLVMVLFVSAAVAMAQTNQSTTQSVCISNQPYVINPTTGGTYTWSITPGVAGTNWTINGTSNSITVDWLTTGTYTLSVFTTALSCPGSPVSVVVTVVAQPVGPTLLAKTPDLADVCVGTDVSATFTAGSGGVGCSDVFEYSYDNSASWVPYTPGTPITTTGHTKVDIRGQRAGCTADLGCTGTPWVTLASWNVTPLLIVSVDITAGVDPVCAGTSVTYTANPTNGGTAPTYAWHVNGGGVVSTLSTYTYVPTVGDIITCDVVSNLTCTSPLPVTGTFTPVVNPLPVTDPIFHN
jgi:hypothetical protein